MTYEPESFLRKLLRKSPLVIFGERGVGKSSFLISLAKFLAKRLDYKVFLIMREKITNLPENIELVCVPNDSTLSDYLQLLKNALLKALKLIDKEKSTKSDVAILIDDLVPRSAILAHPDNLDLKEIISRVLLLGKILSEMLGCVFVVTALENIYRGKPFWYKYYLKFGFNFSRIERISRVRRVCLIESEGNEASVEKECISAILVNREFIFTQATHSIH